MANNKKDTSKKKVIDTLNEARARELHAISLYMSQHYALDAMDYGELAAKMKLIAIDEMRHAENFAERIKELGGEPVTGHGSKVVRGNTVLEIFNSDVNVEDDAIEMYNQAVNICRENNDNISMKLFETIIAEEQLHMNYFENISQHVKNLGDTYLSKIAGTSASTGPTSKSFALNLNPGATA
ncbi:ferritin-like domain-containing protein [Desulfovibrio litoralis]|uniref:Bacterioferritin n=1 Tax=Desulfovibrio litoralis DSM 11393 TaxID=1121455 RepID=A0A1M7SNN3_9BACT|nr:ferritin-like domain-containing protein [Desulfovibrio litoralis]SHN60048.1 bacterioferritin [Desulfovibrio litoralis DSM 11393]